MEFPARVTVPISSKELTVARVLLRIIGPALAVRPPVKVTVSTPVPPSPKVVVPVLLKVDALETATVEPNKLTA